MLKARLALSMVKFGGVRCLVEVFFHVWSVEQNERNYRVDTEYEDADD